MIENEFEKENFSWDKNTKYYQSEAEIVQGGVVAITCYDWSKEDQDKYNWKDNLSIEIFNPAVATFIRENS